MDVTKILWISPYGMLRGEIDGLRERYKSLEIFTLSSHSVTLFEILNYAKKNDCNVIVYTNIHSSIENDLVMKVDSGVDVIKSHRITKYTGNRYYDSGTEEYVYESVPVHQYWEDMKSTSVKET